ncbi:hypothetical protein HK105_200458 [Polyrhizophydium stewartii]|uniref:Uncharacterized protein n=1 Tax=Polyrhizophydium stewartii TaxID=2732419 RepID=A0ABR4NLM7_9FUNG
MLGNVALSVFQVASRLHETAEQAQVNKRACIALADHPQGAAEILKGLCEADHNGDIQNVKFSSSWCSWLEDPAPG